VCREDVGPEHTGKVPRLLTNMLNSLKIVCRGCSATLVRGDLAAHLHKCGMSSSPTSILLAISSFFPLMLTTGAEASKQFVNTYALPSSPQRAYDNNLPDPIKLPIPAPSITTTPPEAPPETSPSIVSTPTTPITTNTPAPTTSIEDDIEKLKLKIKLLESGLEKPTLTKIEEETPDEKPTPTQKSTDKPIQKENGPKTDKPAQKEPEIKKQIIEPNCPNRKNQFHTCSSYCTERYGPSPTFHLPPPPKVTYVHYVAKQNNANNFFSSSGSDRDTIQRVMTHLVDVDRSTTNDVKNPYCPNIHNLYHKCTSFCFEVFHDHPYYIAMKNNNAGRAAINSKPPKNPHCPNATNDFHECTNFCFDKYPAPSSTPAATPASASSPAPIPSTRTSPTLSSLSAPILAPTPKNPPPRRRGSLAPTSASTPSPKFNKGRRGSTGCKQQ
jgi:hypothetical protein